MIEVIEAAGPRIVVDAAESGQKQKRGAIVRRRVVNLFAALLGFDRHSFKPFRHAFAQIFLKKRLSLDTVGIAAQNQRSEEHTSELQSHSDLVCRLLLEKKKQKT